VDQVDSPDPIEAIKFRMEQQGLTRKDLEPIIGTRTRVAEVLKRKRGLSIGMLRRLRERQAGSGRRSHSWAVSISTTRTGSSRPRSLMVCTSMLTRKASDASAPTGNVICLSFATPSAKKEAPNCD
jgi:hypothetical protein